MTDPYAHLRHLDQTEVTAEFTEVIEDPEGDLDPVHTTAPDSGVLSLPPLPEEDDDE